MKIKYNREINTVKFRDLEIGDTFTLESGDVFVKTRFFSVCNRKDSKCVPIDYNVYNLSLNYFSYLTDDDRVTKVNCTLEVN